MKETSSAFATTGCLRALRAALFGALALTAAARADALGGEDGEQRHREGHPELVDHDRARQALIRGEIAPLEKVLEAVRSEVEGDFVGAELEIEHNLWVYDLKFIDRRGMLRKIHVNAKTAQVISRDKTTSRDKPK